MKILTLVVGRDDGVVLPYYGIEHEGHLWLVTSWLIYTPTGVATPERMIRIDPTNSNKSHPGEKFHYTNILLPTAVIEGLSQDIQGFEVRSLPNSPSVHRSDLKMLPSIFG